MTTTVKVHDDINFHKIIEQKMKIVKENKEKL